MLRNPREFGNQNRIIEIADHLKKYPEDLSYANFLVRTTDDESLLRGILDKNLIKFLNFGRNQKI